MVWSSWNWMLNIELAELEVPVLPQHHSLPSWERGSRVLRYSLLCYPWLNSRHLLMQQEVAVLVESRRPSPPAPFLHNSDSGRVEKGAPGLESIK